MDETSSAIPFERSQSVAGIIGCWLTTSIQRRELGFDGFGFEKNAEDGLTPNGTHFQVARSVSEGVQGP